MKRISECVFFFFNDTATTEIYTLSLHDALPISVVDSIGFYFQDANGDGDIATSDAIFVFTGSSPPEIGRAHV